MESKKTASEPEGQTITEHLEELRSRIINSIIFIILGCGVSFLFAHDYLLPWLMGPILDIEGVQLLALAPTEKFFAYFKIGFAVGLVIASPFVLYQFWLFVRPGLTRRELRAVRGLLLTTIFLFLAGCAFVFYLILPVALGFLLKFDLGFEMLTQIALDKYLSFALFLTLSGGLVFQIPLISYFLSLVGLLAPETMARFRKYALLGAVILGAALTPTGDPITLSLLAGPIYLLYEISILVSKAVYKKREEEDIEFE